MASEVNAVQEQAPSLTLDPTDVHYGANGGGNDPLVPTTPHTHKLKSMKNGLSTNEDPIEGPHRKNVCNRERLECLFEDGYNSSRDIGPFFDVVEEEESRYLMRKLS
eukprot:5928666-Ditylum_brightwellii.AAC.1